jgi:hypothetical protein
MPDPDVQIIDVLRSGVAELAAEIIEFATVALPHTEHERAALPESIIAATGDIQALAQACAVLIRRPDLA